MKTEEVEPRITRIDADIRIQLPNETKIKFGNAFHAMQNHLGDCEDCCEYLYHGNEDLCAKGKEIIARELAYADTSVEFPKQ